MIGQTIAHYRIVEKLGEGGMGVVYKARDTHLDRFVAIKVLPPERLADAERERRFVQEAKAASALNHPNIITIHDIGHAEGVSFIAMEYIAGRPLDQVIGPAGLKPNEALKYAVQLADALAAAHAAGIVHRDLKPGNIMVTASGLVKVLDFGLAKLTAAGGPEDETVTVGTAAGTILGTVAYMSPEQAEGKPVDARSDVFSFGAVVYEMLTGHKAFLKESKISTLRAIVCEEPAQYPTDIPLEVQRVLGRCLRKDRNERFQHTADLKLALEEALRPSAAPASIAVLPFANLSADKENEYFSDGLTEEIINALTKVPGLRVTARTSAFAFRGKEADIREIAARLNVEHILEGSVRRAGSRIRITAQLIKAGDGYHLWSERYDRELTDVFAIQDEISEAITEKLRACLAGERPRVKQPTQNLEAYDLYIQGLYEYHKFSPEGFRKAIGCFTTAIDLDPQFALAWAWLASTHAMLGMWGNLPTREALTRAEEFAVKALHLDDALPEAHIALGTVHWVYHWDHASAEREFRRAVELSPSHAAGHCTLALFLGSIRRDFPAAVAEMRLAQELDPLSVYIRSMSGWVYHWARQFDHAIAQSRKVLEMDANFLQAHYILGMSLLETSPAGEAIAVLERALAIYGDSLSLAWLGMACGRAGDRERARAILGELEARAKSQHILPMHFFYLRMGLGEHERALEWLEQAFQERDPHVPFIGVSPICDPLRSNPRFHAVLRRMNLEP